MKFLLDKYIDNYAKNAKYPNDEKIALHLKDIIPKTTHLDENIYSKVVEDLRNEIEKDNEKGFKNAFMKVCKKYILIGDVIKAELPFILTRIILNEFNFIKEIAQNFSIAPDLEESLESIIKPEDIINAVDSKDKEDIEKTFGDSKLHSRREVVFATFDEDEPASDPFLNNNIEDIINMLALDTSVFKKNEPLTAVSIRYRNRDDVKKRFPVFTDAGWYGKFYPSERDDKYGRTKPLDKAVKGMPEIVHENLKLADVIEDIRFLEE
jgi:hypothetical protein